MDVYISQNGEYVHFITVKEPLCEAMNKYLGDFMHGIQEAVGLKAGSCPVAPVCIEIEKKHKVLLHFFYRVTIK